MALGGTTGAGTAWILKMWDSPALVDVVRLFVRNADTMQAVDGGWAGRLRDPAYRYLERRRRNSETGSRRNIGAHYDLGNDFFQLFLDDSMTYSAGVFPTAATSLADAQRRKYDLICRKLDLQAGERVIEIGTGWGGFALHAAQHYGVHVTTTTISELLTPQGQALIQAITIRDHNYDVMRASQDFIREYIFPGGQLPCVAELLNVARHHTDLNLFDLDDFGQDYATTLALWRDAFHRHASEVAALGYSEEFRRMWDYYLASCEGAFREASISVVHLLYTKPRCTRGPLRDRAGATELPA